MVAHRDNPGALAWSWSWSYLSVFSPPSSKQGDVVVLSDAGRGKRVAIQRNPLLDFIADTFTGTAAHSPLMDKLADLGLINTTDCDDDKGIAQAAHWQKRGWHQSLDYYLWSRQSRFVDRVDVTKEQRIGTIQRYIEQDGTPPPRLVPTGQRRPLPNPTPLPKDITLGKVLMERRSIRTYVPESVPGPILSAVLWFGLDRVRHARRSLAADDPFTYLISYGVAFDFYLVVYGTEGLEPGVYYYDILAHNLVEIRQGKYRQEMVHDLFGTVSPNTAGWTVVLVADFAQYIWRYRHGRALRNLYIESGRVVNSLLLAAAACGLGTLVTPAMRDRHMSALLAVDPMRQAPIYTATMGFDRRYYKR